MLNFKVLLSELLVHIIAEFVIFVLKIMIIIAFGLINRINGCVGEQNYKLFLFFIFSQFTLCLLGFLMAWKIWSIKYQQLNSYTLYLPGGRINSIISNYKFILKALYISQNQAALSFYMMICGVVCLLLAVFIG